MSMIRRVRRPMSAPDKHHDGAHRRDNTAPAPRRRMPARAACRRRAVTTYVPSRRLADVAAWGYGDCWPQRRALCHEPAGIFGARCSEAAFPISAAPPGGRPSPPPEVPISSQFWLGRRALRSLFDGDFADYFSLRPKRHINTISLGFY